MPVVKGKKRAYPMGGLGLDPEEEEKFQLIIKTTGLSLKYVLRYLVRKVLRGELEIKP